MHVYEPSLVPWRDAESSAAGLVRAIYRDATTAHDPKTLALLETWLSRFRLIHGELDTQRQQNIASIPQVHGVSTNGQRELFLFVFALEVYFTLVMRLLGYRAVTQHLAGRADVRHALSSQPFTDSGLLNYATDEIFDVFLRSPNALEKIRTIAGLVDQIDIRNYDRDLIKYLHHDIFPRTLRHSLGEIFTPDWLAELVRRDLVSDDSAPSERTFLDPTCGSGTFLVELLRTFGERSGGRILDRIAGFDINPVSVLAAKTNLILAGQQWLAARKAPYLLPIFEADCIRSSFSDTDDLFTSNSQLDMPAEIIQIGRKLIARNRRGISQLPAAYTIIQQSAGVSPVHRDRLLATIAPSIVRDVDYVIGNPPWVNWEYLPDDYRRKTIGIWQLYELFDLKGRESTFIKEDIAALITYVSADRYLRTGGRLGFVIKQTLFKSSKHGEGFRKFRLGSRGLPLKVLKVEDLSKVRTFPGVSARAAVLVLQKGQETTYPVTYNEWNPGTKATLSDTASLDTVLGSVSIRVQQAFPSEDRNSRSGWTSADASVREEIVNVLGESAYRARTGVFTGGLNAVYWLQILEDRHANVLATNLTARAKNKVSAVQAEIEKGLVYPFLIGSDLRLWAAHPSKHILMPHTATTKMEPLREKEMRSQYPLGWKYLDSFRSALEARKGFAGWEKHLHREYYYALQRIGDYTFARYKVGWKFISRQFTPAVITPVLDPFLGERTVIPNEKVIFVGLDNEDEAYYLCGVLSSSIYKAAVESFMVETQIGPGVLQKLRVPQFDPSSSVHQRISSACRTGHSAGTVAQEVRAIDAIVRLL